MTGGRRQPAASPGRGRRSDWRQALGAAAEDLAARHLTAQGCRILARRYRVRGGEIDLVVRDGDLVVFVEVKARRVTTYGRPVQGVTPRKQQRMATTARRFLRDQGLGGAACRFDVVTVDIDGGRAHVDWLRDAFRP